MNRYDHKTVEQKWRDAWNEAKVYRTTEDSNKEKFYILDMFPYPSGAGLHVGHPKGYIATDIISRYKKMNGFNVLHPMGWDAFGLPAEQHALKNKVHPSINTNENIARYKEQLEKISINYDWERELSTTDPDFYKWTQWAFIQMFKKGLVYESNEPINWCPSCKTGLANEDLEDGRCERCDSEIEKKPIRQWIIKITDYADRLLDDIDKLDWQESIKESQRNWIGKSEGAEIDFKIKDSDDKIKVFTTRPDTLFGATYMVLAPEHSLVQEWLSKLENKAEVEKYIKETGKKTHIERGDMTKEKTGVELKGVKAVNPVNSDELPIYIADYVMADYGTGAIMAVPAHDERDYEFAKKYGIDVRQVVRKVFGEPLENPVPRVAVGAVIYNHKTGKYLIQYSKEFKEHSFVFGGVEDEEDYIKAAIRETLEETGYKTKFIKYLTDETEAHFYHPGKKVNRALFSRRVLLEVTDDTPETVSEEELKKHTPVWLTESELFEKIITDGDKFALESLHDTKVYTGKGNLCNSSKFDGMNSEEAKKAITEFVGGKMTISYKLRDWVFARQRYWGEPIPLIHCVECGVVPVPDDELPLVLPEVESYEPTGTGESPLAGIDEWVNTKCPSCGGDAKRETNTMPQWAGSSWYYLRYIDPHNDSALVDKEKEKYWSPVDFYVGGAEHATRHLIYARFWHKFLFDIGVVSYSEPFTKLQTVGLIMAEDGRKMSKRWGNVINPDDVIDEYGADAFRTYEMFMGPFDQAVSWSTKGLLGPKRFLDKVWKAQEYVNESTSNNNVQKQLNKTIKKVGEDISDMKYNTAISQMMIFVNTIEKEKSVTKNDFESFLKVLSPFAPHITQELWSKLGNETFLIEEQWPEYDKGNLIEDTVTIAVQVNGKVRAELTVPAGISEKDIKVLAMADEAVDNWVKKTGNGLVKQFIYITGRVANIVVQ